MHSSVAAAVRPGKRLPADAAARVRRFACILALVALVAIVRWPFHNVVGEDESFFLVVGHQWVLGVPPYIGSYDVKPPGLFALVAVAERIFGDGIPTIKLLELAAVAATDIAIYLFARRHLTAGAAVVGSVLYAIASLDLSGVNSAAELLSSAFVSLGMLVGWNALRAGRPSSIGCGLAGLLIGAALSIKQPAVFEGAVLVLMTLASSPARRWKLCLIEVGAMAAAPLAFAAFYALNGHFDALLADAVFGAAGRMKGDNLSWGDAFLRAPPMLKPVVPLVAFALLIWVERRRLRDLDAYPSVRFLALWLAGAFAGVLAVKAMYDHYSLTLLPPLALLSGFFIDRLPIGLTNRRWRLATRVILTAATLAYLLKGPLPYLAPASGEIAAEQQIASQMRALHQRPEDRILVLNRHLAVYLFANAEPPTAVFHPLQLLCPFPQFGARDPVANAFAAKPAFIVLADPAITMVCELPDRRREVGSLLARDYCAVGRSATFVSAGLPDSMTVYARRDRAGDACRNDIAPPTALDAVARP